MTPLDDVLWAHTAPPAPSTSTVDRQIDTDIAIVGAGYSGLSAALHLAERGSAPVVIEASEIGYGGSGRNAGHCTPTFQHLSLAAIRRLFGEPWGDRMIALQTGAAQHVFDIVDRYAINCELVRNGFLQVAHTPAAFDKIRARQQAYADLGIGCHLVDQAETARLTGSPRFYGGWLLEEAGHLNPLAYARGLAKAAIGQGARIYTNSPVTRISPRGKRWVVSTNGGSVVADKVVLATGAYTGNLWPGLSSGYSKATVACLASAPLPAELRQSILPDGNHVLDTRGDFTNMRIDASGRLITSVFVERVRGKDRAFTERLLTDRFRWVFPQLSDLSWEYFWTGDVDLHPQTFPQYLGLAEGVTALVGYSSRGVPTATVMGRVVADHLGGMPQDALDVPLKPLRSVPFGFGWAAALLPSVYRWRDARHMRHAGIHGPVF